MLLVLSDILSAEGVKKEESRNQKYGASRSFITSRYPKHVKARCLASSVLSLQTPSPEPVSEVEEAAECEIDEGQERRKLDVSQASKLKGPEARNWFAKQFMLPEWMIDVPDRLNHDWKARPAGKRCIVVSSKGTTVSRLRNGAVLHHFPSALPSGSRKKTVPDPAQSFSVLDCIFHEQDQTYYVIDMVCWRGYSLYDCSAEFRFFWLNSKLAETGALPYVKDGLIFYNKHVLYQTGDTPLVLVWKDENSSQYVIDTDNKGHMPIQQQVVFELQEDGKLPTSDDPPVVFGCLDGDFIQKSGLLSASLLRFSIRDGGLTIVDGKLEKADLEYLGKSNRARAFADSYSKVMFQFMSRNSPLKVNDLLVSMNSSSEEDSGAHEVQMIG
uniref:Snurportin-1 n=1 Tax=Kalanchoe fedtschenkoi TaxID=63787 RepID=A0A7N0UY15_KALFE